MITILLVCTIIKLKEEQHRIYQIWMAVLLIVIMMDLIINNNIIKDLKSV